jgi:hypothetical protein
MRVRKIVIEDKFSQSSETRNAGKHTPPPDNETLFDLFLQKAARA